ncbi:hypothetical protein ABIF68_005570 [Bradyrhizobium japonicum]|uniref:hypothetical protein n=1 Tax=Bradyrhizobium TaxID=374 RepID=UPI00192BBC2A|nr:MULTISPECIES: hypothetical protein [Bradyrhizobium]MDI2077333.1 hypothetical protein [Bradyrhizobium sp. Mp27]
MGAAQNADVWDAIAVQHLPDIAPDRLPDLKFWRGAFNQSDQAGTGFLYDADVWSATFDLGYISPRPDGVGGCKNCDLYQASSGRGAARTFITSVPGLAGDCFDNGHDHADHAPRGMVKGQPCLLQLPQSRGGSGVAGHDH